MIRRFLRWLTDRLPVVVKEDKGVAFLERYHLGTFAGARWYLHHYIASDPDRGLHDHPWSWAVTIILAGWYIEERRDRPRIRSIGYTMDGDTFHRVILPAGSTMWSLFVHGPYTKPWGFFRPADWLRIQSWRDPEGGLWMYQARPNKHKRFSDWHKTATKGRELRLAAGAPQPVENFCCTTVKTESSHVYAPNPLLARPIFRKWLGK